MSDERVPVAVDALPEAVQDVIWQRERDNQAAVDEYVGRVRRRDYVRAVLEDIAALRELL